MKKFSKQQREFLDYLSLGYYTIDGGQISTARSLAKAGLLKLSNIVYYKKNFWEARLTEIGYAVANRRDLNPKICTNCKTESATECRYFTHYCSDCADKYDKALKRM